jgi:hypothetical protein
MHDPVLYGPASQTLYQLLRRKWEQAHHPASGPATSFIGDDISALSFNMVQISSVALHVCAISAMTYGLVLR